MWRRKAGVSFTPAISLTKSMSQTSSPRRRSRDETRGERSTTRILGRRRRILSADGSPPRRRRPSSRREDARSRSRIRARSIFRRRGSRSSRSSSTTSRWRMARCGARADGRTSSSATRTASTASSSTRSARRRRGRRLDRGRGPAVSLRPHGRGGRAARRRRARWMANLGCLELHPHPVRAEDLDHPDELRVDLDPVPGVEWPQIVAVGARRARGAVRPRPRGLAQDLRLARHPRQRAHSTARWSFDAGAALPPWPSPARWSGARPTLATSKWWKEERHGVFLDYNQNAKDRTVASAYSVRPKPDARVSAPLTWDGARRVPARRTSRCARCPTASPQIGDRHAAIDDASVLARRGCSELVRAPGSGRTGRRALAAALREAAGRARRASQPSRREGRERRVSAASPTKPLHRDRPRRAEGGRPGRARTLEGPASGGAPHHLQPADVLVGRDARALRDVDARAREPGARAGSAAACAGAARSRRHAGLGRSATPAREELRPQRSLSA